MVFNEINFDCINGESAAMDDNLQFFFNSESTIMDLNQEQFLHYGAPYPHRIEEENTSLLTHCGEFITRFDGEEGMYPQGDKDYAKYFYTPEAPKSSSIEWTKKPMRQWNSGDIKNWLLETGTSQNLKIVQIPLFQFDNINGYELMRMSKEAFCSRMFSEANRMEYMLMGETLYSALQTLINYEYLGEASIVPVSVEQHNEQQYEDTVLGNNCVPELFDMDSGCKSSNLIDMRNSDASSSYEACDSGDDSLSEVPDVVLVGREPVQQLDGQADVPVLVKRPPGRPRGSGKQHPKRVKNVSVPEFLRDLLLNPKYCPRIIKWEEYTDGKFRFVNPNEVARLWGGKRNNKSMSFEKFSRAMRYHYKHDVLNSVPTARLVYKFGGNAPRWTTEDPNFERTSYEEQDYNSNDR